MRLTNDEAFRLYELSCKMQSATARGRKDDVVSMNSDLKSLLDGLEGVKLMNYFVRSSYNPITRESMAIHSPKNQVNFGANKLYRLATRMGNSFVQSFSQEELVRKGETKPINSAFEDGKRYATQLGELIYSERLLGLRAA